MLSSSPWTSLLPSLPNFRQPSHSPVFSPSNITQTSLFSLKPISGIPLPLGSHGQSLPEPGGLCHPATLGHSVPDHFCNAPALSYLSCLGLCTPRAYLLSLCPGLTSHPWREALAPFLCPRSFLLQLVIHMFYCCLVFSPRLLPGGKQKPCLHCSTFYNPSLPPHEPSTMPGVE